MIAAHDLPKDPRHQRLADLVLAGSPRGEAYAKIYPKAAKTSRNPLAAKILRRADVKAYMTAIRLAAAKESHLTVSEKRDYLARAVRTHRKDILPESGEHSDLVISWSRSDSEASSSYSIRTVNPIDAITRDNELAGDTINPLDALATAFANLGAG